MTVFRNAKASVLVALPVVFTCIAAHATPIPGGTTPANDLIINFNFTGQTPAPPYTSINVTWTSPSTSPNGFVTTDAFQALNGGDYAISTLTTSITLNSPGFTDGIFSLGMRVQPGETGDVSISSFIAIAFINNSPVASVGGTLANVPEPTSLALLGVGVAGLVTMCGRKAA